jgi:hypothetical protein
MTIRTFIRGSDGTFSEQSNILRTNTLEVVTHAEEGTVGSSQVVFDDPAADLSIGGWRGIYFQETEATSDDFRGFFWTGYTAQRKIKRDPARAGSDARTVTVSLDDLNWRLHNRLMVGNDANRPAETSAARLTWLLSTAEANFIEDTEFVNTASPVDMDKCDYRGQYLRDILDDISQATGKDYWLVNRPDEDSPNRFGLWFDRSSSSNFASTTRISNVYSDVAASSNTYAAAYDTELTQDPSRVYSGAYITYDGGWYFESRASTATEFFRRDGTVPAANVKTRAKARNRARRYLSDHNTEEDIISTAIVVPPSEVNCIVAGQRVQCRFTHLPGYENFTWLRAMSRTVRQIGPNKYELALELSTDRPGTGATACTGLTATGSFYPLGGADNTPNASDGNVIYWRPGLDIPVEPTPGHVGSWHFPQYGAGGEGTTDLAGDCSQNRVRCIVVGDGTIEVHTAAGDGRALEARLQHFQDDMWFTDEVQTGNSGDSFTFSVSTHGGIYCTHWVDVRDLGTACGGKWGFTGFDWTAEE